MNSIFFENRYKKSRSKEEEDRGGRKQDEKGMNGSLSLGIDRDCWAPALTTFLPSAALAMVDFDVSISSQLEMALTILIPPCASWQLLISRYFTYPADLNAPIPAAGYGSSNVGVPRKSRKPRASSQNLIMEISDGVLPGCRMLDCGVLRNGNVAIAQPLNPSISPTTHKVV